MVPSQITTVNTEVIGSNVFVNWTVPLTNGANITSYTILLRGADNSFYPDSTYCNGSTSQILTDSSCLIPMSEFWAPPFNLT